MKFLSFEVNGQGHLGSLTPQNRVIDLTSLLREQGNLGLDSLPRNVSDLIRLGGDWPARLSQMANDADAHNAPSLEDVTVLPPLALVKNVFCVGRNYRDHIIEGNLANGRPAMAFPEAIEFFSKPPTAIVGHGANVLRHAELTNSLDYEVELAIVIGKRGVNISREEALEHVFGYTIVNDITARDLQKRHGQWLKGKGLDTSCPMGPVVLHGSAVQNPNQLNVGLSVNGEERQRESTSSMIFTVQDIIAQLSAGMTLEAGDVIATGTPKGVGFAMTPPKCLQAGDVVSAWVEGIGTLTNRITN